MTRRKRIRPRRRHHYGPGFGRADRRTDDAPRRDEDVVSNVIPYEGEIGMARVHTKTARKTYECGRCNFTIAKGTQYRFAQPGFRSRRKLIRCMKPECRFRQSELTTSKMSAVYAAVENAEEQIGQWDGEESSDLESIMSECASEVRTVAEEYASAAEAMGGAGEPLQTKADGLESWADELEGVDFEDKPEIERCNVNNCGKSKGHEGEHDPEEEDTEAEGLDDWRDSCRTACTDLLSNIPEE